jgi:hypothetical protein
MKRKVLYIIGAIVLAILAYYGSFFLRDTVVNEEAPALMEQSETPEFGDLIVEHKKGEFVDVDFIHKGEGRAILSKSDVSKVLRFEDFKVTNGPDLYVWLAKNPNPTSDISSLGDYIDLGRLKGNVGNQNYMITPNIDGYDTVVIWCKQFSQLFSYANLK